MWQGDASIKPPRVKRGETLIVNSGSLGRSHYGDHPSLVADLIDRTLHVHGWYV